MGINIGNEATSDRQYINGQWLDVCSRDNFGFSAKNEKGETVYIRYTDCDWFARLTKQNEQKIAEIKEDIQTYKHNQELAYEAERESARAVGQMRREWGVTLADADDTQKEEFRTERNKFYHEGMTAVSFGNKIQSCYSSIRNLQSKPSIFI